MGGTISAQSASLTLLFHERHLPTNFLPPLFRYRDNYLTLLSSHFFNNSQINNHTQLLDHIKNKLSSCIHMKLKVENIGASIPFLEAQLTITDSFPSLSLKLPCLNHQPGMSNPPTPNRWLDNTSPNTQSAMSSVIPNAVGKCLFFRFDVQTLVTNLYHLSKVLLIKQYPHEWWRPQMLSKCAKVGHPNAPLAAINKATIDLATTPHVPTHLPL